MPQFRCPKHDLIFDAIDDARPPGSAATDHHPAHPLNGHPECPLCKDEPQEKEES